MADRFDLDKLEVGEFYWTDLSRLYQYCYLHNDVHARSVALFEGIDLIKLNDLHAIVVSGQGVAVEDNEKVELLEINDTDEYAVFVRRGYSDKEIEFCLSFSDIEYGLRTLWKV